MTHESCRIRNRIDNEVSLFLNVTLEACNGILMRDSLYKTHIDGSSSREWNDVAGAICAAARHTPNIQRREVYQLCKAAVSTFRSTQRQFLLQRRISIGHFG